MGRHRMSMNDPHVARLRYRIEHSDSVDFNKAEPLVHETELFELRVEAGAACFDMKEHFATEAEAREAVAPFITAWELDADLHDATDRFRLEFDRAEVIDRQPTPGVIHVDGLTIAIELGGDVKVHVGRHSYPKPGAHLSVNPTVELMWDRYRRYVEGRTSITDAAYFCVTALEAAAGGRSKIPTKFGISVEIIKQMGNLSSEKGGSEARKARGAGNPMSDAERRWLTEAIKLVLRRVAQVCANPSAVSPALTKADLPKL
ncbi:MAG: hypothetical protein RID91_13130 [Azospirillaceae bacterium]